MKIFIDKKEINVTDKNKNIVEIAKDNNIGIPAPCFLNNRKDGCCNACVILIDGEFKYACTIKAKEGMNITVDTPELKDLRKYRIQKFQEAIKNNVKMSCGGETEDSCCDTGCGSDCNC